MGRSTTPTFVVKFRCRSVHYYTPQNWRVKGMGRPTEANLKKWVHSFEDSTLPGGCNAHLGFQRVVRADLVRQGDVKAVASYSCVVPMFEVV